MNCAKKTRHTFSFAHINQHIMKHFFTFLSLLALLLIVNVGWGQTWTYDFGTGSSSYNTASGSSTSFFSSTPSNGGTYRIRCATTGNQGSGFSLANPGTTLGTGSELQINASGTTSTNKFGVYDWDSPSTVAYVKLKFRNTSSGNGDLNFSLGVNTLVTDNNGYSNQYNNSLVSLTIAYTSGAISSVVRRISGSNTTVASSGLAKDTDQIIEIFANNGSGSVNYSKGGNNSLATRTWDLWVDGVKVVENAATAGTLAAGTNLSGFGFFAESSTSNAAWIYIDDLEYSSTFTPTITLNNNTQIAAGNVNQGATDHLLSRFRVNVTTANATLNQISFVAGGTFESGDITNFKLYTSTDNSFPGGSPLSTVAAGAIANGDAVTFSSLSQACDIGDRYFWVAADVSAIAGEARTVSAPSMDENNFTFALGTPTGTIDAGGAQTFVAVTPSIALSSPSPSAANITQGVSNQVVYRFDLGVTVANAVLNGVTITTAGTYIASDLTNLKCWYSADNSFDPGSDELLSTKTTALGAGSQVFPSFSSKTINEGTTGYIFITVDLPVSATEGNTISVNAITTSDISFVTGNKSGTANASGIKTIIACTPTNVTGLGLTPGNTQITVSWTNPACYDELMIVAKPTSSIGASPSGDGTAYTANLAFGIGGATAFDGTGYVVYKGSSSPQTITGLTNGTTYYVKVFTRKGSVWSSGEESSAIPTIPPIIWSNTGAGSAWYTNTNWSPNTSSSSWLVTDVAQFQNTGSASTAGINMGTATLSIGAIEVTSARTRALTIGNSSATAGILTLNGAIVNSITRTVLRNNSTHALTLQDNESGSGKTMNIIFANTTNNNIRVDGSGGIIIRSVILSAAGPLTISGNGSGVVEFSGQNTYTTNTIVSGSVLRLNRTGGTTIPASNNVTVSGGTLRISSNQALNNLTINESGNLIVDGGVTLTINGALTLNESVTIAGNLVIGSSGEAVIAAEKVLTNSGTLTIKSNASGTGSLFVNGSIDGAGSFSLERYLPQAAQTWHFLSAPVNGSIAANGFNPGGTEDFFAWSESSPGTWVNYANTTVVPTFETVNGSNFVKGRGYLVAYIGVNPTKTFTSGTITTGNVDIQLKRSESKSWTYEPGWNLLGNPYTSGIDWNLADRAKFEDNYAYVYDPNKGGGAGFVNINGGNANAYIAANQGFFVRAKDGENNQNFTFTNAMQIPNGSFMKQQTIEDQLVLKLSFGDYYDKSYIQLKPEASAARDKNDALKLFSYDANVPQLFSKSSNDIMLAVNAIPEVNENTQVTMGIRAPAQGTYSLEVIESASVFQNNNLFLKDQKLNIMHNLTHQAVYNFTAAQGDEPNRFLLHFGVVGITEKPSKPALHAYVAAGQLHLLNLHGTAQLEIFDLSGRLLQQHKVVANGKQSVPLALPAGVYVVRATGETNSEAVKVIVQ